jgi:tRNA threonylcarbamoyladenosine biosynthesis protein TsaE
MPILDSHSLEFISRSPEQTRRVGMRLGGLLQSGDVLCLIGDLGAGKTTLVQGIAAGWGSSDAVSSPTFVLVNVYRRPDGGRFHHLDAYRLSGPADAEELDLDSMIVVGPLVVEWAERVWGALPGEHLRMQLDYVDENQRDMVITPHGRRYEMLLAGFRKQVYGG